MSESLKRAVRAAMLRLLAPLAELLLDAGIGVGEFTFLVKLAYVRAAERRVGTGEGGRPNASRIAVLTGLTRVDVAAILKGAEAGEPPSSDRGRQRAERVLTGWWNDPDFHDALGAPAALPVRGTRRSFAALCERYSGDPRFAAILDELVRVRAVRRGTDGRVIAVSRTYATVRWDPEGVVRVGEELGELCTSLLYNLKNPTRPLLVRRVLNAQLDPHYAPVLIRQLSDQAAATADSMEETLNDPQYTVRPPGARDAMRLGVGIYLFEGSVEENSDSEEEPGAVPTGKSRTPRRKRK